MSSYHNVLDLEQVRKLLRTYLIQGRTCRPFTFLLYDEV